MSIQDRVFKIISKQATVPKEEIFNEVKLFSLGIDLSKEATLIIAIENEFDIRFNELDLKRNSLIKVEDIVNLVTRTIRS